MRAIFNNISAIVLGWLGGSIINMGLIQTGHLLFPIPGIDTDDMNALAAIMPTLKFKFFIFPFLAHAIGTLIGAVIAGTIATNHKLIFSLSIGGLFLIGGIIINYLLPGPSWFTATDLIIAYIPMAWIGGKIAVKLSAKNN